MTMFYADFDIKEQYGWDLDCPGGPPLPPGKKLTAWKNLKTKGGRKNRVKMYAEHMMQQEGSAKIEDVAPLANRACDFSKTTTEKSKVPVANTVPKMKLEEGVECKEMASAAKKTGLAGLFGAWLKGDSDDDKKGIVEDATVAIGDFEDVVEDTTVAIGDLGQNQKKIRAIVRNLQDEVGDVAGVVRVVDKKVKAVDADLQAFKANHKADFNDLLKQFNDLKLANAPKQSITSGRVGARKRVTINVVPVEEK